MKKLLCFFGWHDWAKNQDGETWNVFGGLDGKYRICKRCLGFDVRGDIPGVPLIYVIILLASFLLGTLLSSCTTLIPAETWQECQKCCENLKGVRELGQHYNGEVCCRCETGHICNLWEMDGQ